MKRGNLYALVLVTVPDADTARTLTQTVLTARLAACVNLVTHLESHYWWKGSIESSTEVLMTFKTTRARLAALKQCVLTHHPYDTPEFLVLPISSGSKRYLEWVSASVAVVSTQPKARRPAVGK